MSGRSDPWQCQQNALNEHGISWNDMLRKTQGVFLLSKETDNLRDENTKTKKNMCMCMHTYRKSKPPSPLSPPLHFHLFSLKFEEEKTKNSVCLPASSKGCFPSLRESDQIWFTSKIARLPMDSSRQSHQNILLGTSPHVKQNQATASIYNHGSLSEKRTLHRTVRESRYLCKSQPALNSASRT